MSDQYNKPLPRFYSEGSREFYHGCKEGKLLIQRCDECKKFRFPPRRMCANCHSLKSEWVESSGRGTVVTYTVIPGFEPRAVPMFSWPQNGYPISVIIVELPDEGRVHMASNLVDCDPEAIEAGMEVEVVFEPVTDEITLPQFRPVARV